MDNQQTPSSPDLIKLNVGGKLFSTTLSTLRSGGPDSLLSALSNSNLQTIFIDRDPQIFSILLSLLRTNRLSSASKHFSTQELVDEASYFGIESHLRSALAPAPLSGIDASLVKIINTSSIGDIYDFDVCDTDSSLWVAYAGLVSVYDWSLSHLATIRTHFDCITSVKGIGRDLAAVGSLYGPGLHFYNVASGRNVGSVEWVDGKDVRIHKAKVNAVEGCEESVFASFDCQHGENCVLMVDKETLRVEREFGRMSGSSAKNMVAKKLKYEGGTRVLVGSSVTSGAFGYSGYIRLWDVRTRDVIWEMSDPGSGRSSRFGDSFADMDVDLDGGLLFKVCSKSGDLGVADMRKLSDDPWMYLKEKNPSMRNVAGSGGGNFAMSCYRKQVFIGREGGLEVWSRVEGCGNEEIVNEESYRRNFVDKIEDSERGVIRKIAGGGDRLFVTRENVEGIEVWQSSYNSGVKGKTWDNVS